MDAARENLANSGIDGCFRIGDLCVDPQAGEVTGPAGREQVDPKVMGVLLMLAERAGQVVPREDLLARLWPGVVVSDDALSRCLYELRRQMSAAGGSGRHRALIETLPKRGYRLAVAVEPAADPPAARPRKLRNGLYAAAAVLIAATAYFGYRSYSPPPATVRVAVLPFLDLSATQDQRYLADGLAEEILDRLSQSPEFEVVARTSSFSFRDRPVDVGVIGRKLDVTHVLEGSVRTSGSRIRVTAQLITAADGVHLWSHTYERERRDLFALQDEISTAVAGELEGRLAPTRAAHTTQDVDALVQYAQGEYFYFRRSEGDLRRAISAFESAVAIDPRYAKAWASLAGAYALVAMESDPPSAEFIDKEGRAAERAVALAPELGVAQFRLAQYYAFTGRLDLALRHFEQAKALAPGDPLVLSQLASNAVDRGDLPAAIACLRRAVAADPLSRVYRNNLATLLQASGQLEAALREYEFVRASLPGFDSDIALDIVRTLVLMGRYREAIDATDALPAGRPKDHATALLVAAPGMRAASDAALTRLARDPVPGALQPAVLDSVQLAAAYALRGRKDEALAVLEGKRRALEGRPGAFRGNAWYLQHEARLSPFLKPLHSDPRWAAFMGEPG